MYAIADFNVILSPLFREHEKGLSVNNLTTEHA